MDAVEWLRRGLQKEGKTQAGVAKAIGKDPSIVSKILKGTRQLRANELPKIASYIEEPAPRVEVAAGEANSRQLPVLGAARGGKEGVVQIDPDPTPIGYIECPPGLMGVPDAYAVAIDGDSMATTGLKHGTKVWVNPHRRPRGGDLIVLVKTNSEAIVKRLVRETDGHLVLSQTDPPEEFKVLRKEIRAIHLVVGVWFGP